MIRKVLLFSFSALLGFLLVLPSDSASAYSGGFLNGSTLNLGTDHNTTNSTISSVTDNDVSTFITIDNANGNDTLWYTLTSPVSINTSQLKSSTSMEIEYYDANGISLGKNAHSGNGLTFEFNWLSGVKKIALRNTSFTTTKQVYEFDVFGSIYNYKTGLLDKAVFTVTNTNFSQFTATYNNIDTDAVYATLNPYDVTYTFDVPYNIEAIFVNGQVGDTFINFYDLNGVSLYRMPFQQAGTASGKSYYYKLPNSLTNVKSVKVENTSVSTGQGNYLKEIDFFDYKDITPPANVGNLRVDTVTQDDVLISWADPPDSDFKEVKVFKDGTYLKTVPKGVRGLSDIGLTHSTTYQYSFVSVDFAGNESTSVSLNVVTKSPDVTPPQEITTLTESHTDKSVQLSWSLTTDPDRAGIKIYQNGTLIATLPSSDTSYVVNGLTASSTYDFKITTIDAKGNESSGVTKTLTTNAMSDITPPYVPVDLDVKNGYQELSVSWKKNTDDAIGYNVYVDGVKHNSSLITGTSYKVTGLKNGQTYSITISAVDLAGNESVVTASKTGTPTTQTIPTNQMTLSYKLKDVADGIGSNFGWLWLIVAFSVGITLAFLIGTRIKSLFVH